MRLLTALTVAFIVIFLFGWAFHGVLLAEQYAALPALYRSEAETRELFGWLLGGQFLVAVALVLLLQLHQPSLSVALGIRFGFLIGLLSAGSQLAGYAVMPIPLSLLAWWVAGSLLEMTALGALLADILRDE